jgi:hypothetical protein
MTDAAVTTAPGATASTAPGAAPPQPRPGSIPDHQYDRLDPAEQSKYARVQGR